MDTPEIRWANAKDTEALLGLLEEYHEQEGFRRQSKERVKALLDEILAGRTRGRILIAFKGSEVLGYALMIRRVSFEWASEVAVLDEIFVRGKGRGRGLGRRMISFLEEYAASEGLPAIALEVSSQNVQAREFYRSVGFQRMDREIYSRPVRGTR